MGETHEARPLVIRSFWAMPWLATVALCVAGLLLAHAYLEGRRSIFERQETAYAVVIIALGFLSGLAHRGVTINPDGTKLTSWWWFILRFGTGTYAVAGASEVRIAPETGGLTGPRAGVGVRVVFGHESVLVGSVGAYGAARRRAELVARAVGKRIVDATTDPPSVRSVGRLDEAVGFKVSPDGAQPAVPPMPERCRISWSVDGDRTVFELPERGLQSSQTAFACFIIFYLAVNLLDLYLTAGHLRSSVLWLGGIAATVVLVIWINASLSHEVVRVADGMLTVTKAGRAWGRARSIDVDEIEELVVARRDGTLASATPLERGGLLLHARSDRTTLVFGADLQPWEGEWLRRALEAVIART